MEKDIDIYEILKGMPDGTPLYTPMCGNVEFTSVEADKEKSRAIWTEIEKPEKQAFEIGKLYVFDEEDEDGNVTVIGELIGKNESKDTLKFGNQYEIENEKFVTDQAFDLRISVHEELREATELEVELFNKHCALWMEKEKEAKEQPVFKTFDKVLVRDSDAEEWEPAIFIRMSRRRTKKELPYQVFHLLNGTICEMAHCITFEENGNIAFTDYDIEDLPF